MTAVPSSPASNGHLYIYKGTGVATSPFKARVDIGGGWSGYAELVGTPATSTATATPTSSRRR